MKTASMREPSVVSRQVDRELDQAIHRVYQTYGSDLSVFFRAVQQQLNLERQEAQKKRGNIDHLENR